MRKLMLISAVLVAGSLRGMAQVHMIKTMSNPVEWTYTFSIPPKSGVITELIFTGTIPAGWYLYSNDFDPDLGPMPTVITFRKDSSYTLLGTPTAIRPKRKFDEIWNGEISYFEGKAEFRQKVKILNNNPVIKGEIEYQICSNLEGKCVMFTPEFEFKPAGVKVSNQAK